MAFASSTTNDRRSSYRADAPENVNAIIRPMRPKIAVSTPVSRERTTSISWRGFAVPVAARAPAAGACRQRDPRPVRTRWRYNSGPTLRPCPLLTRPDWTVTLARSATTGRATATRRKMFSAGSRSPVRIPALSPWQTFSRLRKNHFGTAELLATRET